MTTDGLRSFALFAYDENSIQWSVPQTRDPRAKHGHAVVGFTSPDNFYTDPRSGTRAISFIDNYPDDRNQYILPQPCTYGAMYIFKLYKEEDLTGSSAKCMNWHATQPMPDTWMDLLPACPCDLDQALNDATFREVNYKSQTCFQTVMPNEFGSGK